MGAPTRLCRDCGRLDEALPHAVTTCPSCGSERILAHEELAQLAIAHVDCDAFYASVEKRDRPELADEPVIVGGSLRGVVLTCCYVARRSGVRSAMAMVHAMRLCPDATVIRPDMEKYRRESLRIRALMEQVAPVVEPVSIDEAYLDLSAAGTHEPPARSLARLALLVERRVGVTVSIGLAPNKMLAKVASDLGKPRGFRIIGASDAAQVLGPMKLRVLPGVGPVTAQKLEALGFVTCADLRDAPAQELIHRLGRWGARLQRFAMGEDGRRVGDGHRRAVTVGAERTFEHDLKDLAEIEPVLAQLCARVAERLARAGLAATNLTLKLRRADRHTTTHACRPRDPTLKPETILATVRPVLARQLGGARYRLVGVTAHDLVPATRADPPDLFAKEQVFSMD
ncbi:MAG TPA: DNA polymerase IV [Stellaceae bacterium]|nr:DNA polymerase IV [Stellaceae bacterium]